MNRYDMCALLCRCVELSELGEETTFHYMPNLKAVYINHYFGKVRSDDKHYESMYVSAENFCATLMKLDRRIYLLREQSNGERD